MTRRRRGGGLRSMRFIVTAVAVLLISGSVLSVGLLGQKRLHGILATNGRSMLLLEARNLAYLSADALLDDYPELVLQPIVQDCAGQNQALAFVVVVDHEGNIRGHVDARLLGRHYEEPAGLEPIDHDLELRKGETLTGNATLIAATATARGADGQPIGQVQVGMQLANLEAVMAAERRGQLLLVAILLGCGCLAALVVMTGLLRPLGAIVRGLDRIGAGDFDARIEVKSATELGFLAGHINRMAIKLKMAQGELVQQERLTHEMDLARRIQESLLPDGRFQLADFQVFGDQKPAFEVGGDFYDVFRTADGRVGLFIADVAGKGLAGCLATSMLASYLRAYRELSLGPAELLARIESQLEQALPRGTFVTAFCGFLDGASGEVEFASAGHHPPLVFSHSEQSLRWIKASGIPLAILRSSRVAPKRETRTLALAPGDVLIQMTDGINEACNAEGEQFGMERVAQIVERYAGSGAEGVLNQLRKAVTEWSGGAMQLDDETLLVVGRATDAARAANADASAGTSEAERLLAEARRRGHAIELGPDLDSLQQIQGWLQQCTGINELSRDDLAIINAALVDACANIIEHGDLAARGGSLDLFWLTALDDPREDYDLAEAPFDGKIWRASRAAWGRFVLRDDASPFDPRNRAVLDLASFKKTGRGLGLRLIDNAAWKLSYTPSTGQGNLTVIQFNPIKFWKNEEVIDV